MSGQNRGPGPQPYHTRHPAIRAAAAAIILLAVGACSSTTTSTPGTAGVSASAVAITGTGPGGRPPTLTGSGSTFDAPFFSVAFAKYQQQHPGVTIGYAAVGSSAGIAAFSARQVDFGASDVPMTAAEQAAATGGPVTQVPVDLGGEGIAYNLSLPAGARLHLTGRPWRPSSSARSPAGTIQPSPPSTPASSCRPRRSPSCTAPTAAAPPTSGRCGVWHVWHGNAFRQHGSHDAPKTARVAARDGRRFSVAARA